MGQTLRQQPAFLSRVETMRSPLANLRVSAEGLALCKDASPEVRSELEGIILDEADRLSASFHEVTRQADVIRNSLWSREDILSSDLLHCVANRLLQMGITVTFTGHPIWVNADGHSMIELMAFVVHRISEHCKSAELEVETLLSDRRVYLHFCGKGVPCRNPSWQAGIRSNSFHIPLRSALLVVGLTAAAFVLLQLAAVLLYRAVDPRLA